jgi:hypothetical protein
MWIAEPTITKEGAVPPIGEIRAGPANGRPRRYELAAGTVVGDRSRIAGRAQFGGKKASRQRAWLRKPVLSSLHLYWIAHRDRDMTTVAHGNPCRILLLVSALSIFAWPETVPERGVAVEQVEKGSSGEKAGLQSDDIILSWSRQDIHGNIEWPLDLTELDIEQTPRGAVTLEGLRGTEKRTWTLPSGPVSQSFYPLGIVCRLGLSGTFSRPTSARPISRKRRLWECRGGAPAGNQPGRQIRSFLDGSLVADAGSRMAGASEAIEGGL